MTYAKELEQLALEFKSKDLKQLEEYELAHEAAQDVMNYINKRMTLKKNQNKIISYKRVLEAIKFDDDGRLLCIDVIRDRIKSDYYYEQAKNMLLRYCIRIHQDQGV